MNRTDRYKEIQLPQLRSFCVVATEGNFTAAARRLGLSTPTVWQQVRALETHLKTTLIRRRGRVVELTDEGRVLLDIVQPHVSGLDSLESLFAARQLQLPPELTVAATPYLASSHLPAAVRTFTAENPEVRLKLRVLIWIKQIVELVERGQADIGIVFQDRKEPLPPQVDFEFVADLPFSLITPARHPLARKRVVTPADWVAYPLVVPPEGAYARRSLDQVLVQHQLVDRVRIVMETPLLDNIQQYVAAGLGIALVHIAGGSAGASKLHIRPLPEQADSIGVAVVTRKFAHLSRPVEIFREALRRSLVPAPVRRSGRGSH
ncbi:LysR family transcriptional regulator [Planctomyces sp. SH-PL14]|uniref:LysR family transcriptional regulator n=1 Tax=Planctomyces sp. SH-PL14 TaxID=1632864 RepID=UPI00078C58BD|nr:LysR family transcriptional regulator [Planctomyces sp. SH-PL14]AMV20482.1 HTH-type transcriptional activator CmpR [Planctomyces sp. SH-PL14]